MLVISGDATHVTATCSKKTGFNLAIEMLVISGPICAASRLYLLSFNLAIEMLVISGLFRRNHTKVRITRFNLAIEMLVISGAGRRRWQGIPPVCFNLAIEMLVISGCALMPRRSDCLFVSISQSRCLSFQGHTKTRAKTGITMFQSRNRDACHFRANPID